MVVFRKILQYQCNGKYETLSKMFTEIGYVYNKTAFTRVFVFERMKSQKVLLLVKTYPTMN